MGRNVIMKIVIGDILEVDVDYPKSYLIFIRIYHSYQKEKIRKSRRACLWYRRQKEICCSHKSFKTSAKSRINTKKSTQSNSI